MGTSAHPLRNGWDFGNVVWSPAAQCVSGACLPLDAGVCLAHACCLLLASHRLSRHDFCATTVVCWGKTRVSAGFVASCVVRASSAVRTHLRRSFRRTFRPKMRRYFSITPGCRDSATGDWSYRLGRLPLASSTVVLVPGHNPATMLPGRCPQSCRDM